VYFGPGCKAAFRLSANSSEFERRVLEHKIYLPLRQGQYVVLKRLNMISHLQIL
jgi:hypothetical protein